MATVRPTVTDSELRDLHDAGVRGVRFNFLKRLVDFQIEEGIHGLIPLGSTGEFLSVTPDERRQIVDIVVKQDPGAGERAPRGGTPRVHTMPTYESRSPPARTQPCTISRNCALS